MDAEIPLLRWIVEDGTECLITSFRNKFEVRLVREGEVVRARQFMMPEPAFETAYAWHANEGETFLPHHAQ